LLLGDTVGQSAAPGASWTIPRKQGSLVLSRKVTVERHEPCGNATCARMRVDYEVDPRAVSDAAVAVVKARVQAAGGDPTKVVVKNSTYAMRGTMLIEPATMLGHGASLDESGTISMTGPSKEEVTVEMKGLTEISYDYAQPTS
jgi:hypothetical protein